MKARVVTGLREDDATARGADRQAHVEDAEDDGQALLELGRGEQSTGALARHRAGAKDEIAGIAFEREEARLDVLLDGGAGLDRLDRAEGECADFFAETPQLDGDDGIRFQEPFALRFEHDAQIIGEDGIRAVIGGEQDARTAGSVRLPVLPHAALGAVRVHAAGLARLEPSADVLDLPLRAVGVEALEGGEIAFGENHRVAGVRFPVRAAVAVFLGPRTAHGPFASVGIETFAEHLCFPKDRGEVERAECAFEHRPPRALFFRATATVLRRSARVVGDGKDRGLGVAKKVGVVRDEAEPRRLLYLRVVFEAVGVGEVFGGGAHALVVARAINAEQHLEAVTAR